MTNKRKLEIKHKCAFTGVESTREHRLRAPCSAATGAPRHLMTRCLKCVHKATVWICLPCWASIATKTKELVGKWDGKFHLLREPVYDALAGSVDFDRLAQGQGDGGSVLTKHPDGQWDWNECCPMCVDFSFSELPPVLTLRSSLALPVVTERTVSGTVSGMSALGVEYLQKVTPCYCPDLHPSSQDHLPFPCQVIVHAYILKDAISSEEEHAHRARLMDALARVRLFIDHQRQRTNPASLTCAAEVYQATTATTLPPTPHYYYCCCCCCCCCYDYFFSALTLALTLALA
tara:strand:- start:415 stop:1284 length:870 start_codon:yes stop_codon:yes gene_type:complete